MGYKKEHKGYWKGKKRSKESIEKMRKKLIGRKLSQEHKDNISKGNMGRKFSEETIKKIAETKKRNGSNFKSKEQRKKISVTLKGRHISPRTEFKKGSSGFTGRHTEETKKRLSKIGKGNKNALGHKVSKASRLKISRANKGRTPPIKGKTLSKETIIKIRKARALQIFPKKDTSIEVKIQTFLGKLHIWNIPHFYIKELTYPYRCDIFVPSLNLIIECDGDYWHGNKDKYKEKQLHKNIIKQRIIDNIRTKELLANGFKVLRLWEHEINQMKLNEFKDKLMEIKGQ